jgi:DNA invertase Pin-like site-specific DNA recombinase
MFRNARDALNQIGDWRDAGCEVHLIEQGGNVTKPGISQMLVIVLAAVAEMEAVNISERTKAVMSHLKANGRPAGQTPWGYRVIGRRMDEQTQRVIDPGRVEAEPWRADALRLMRDCYDAGMDERKIADHLTKECGHSISHMTVRRLRQVGEF